MNEIQEYRKQSAEALGLNIISHNTKETIVMLQKGDSEGWDASVLWHKKWHPDLKENAYQREMIEDWLIEQGYRFEFLFKSAILGRDPVWDILIYSVYPKSVIAKGRDKSKSTAFMKAFMEYIKSESS